MMSRYEEENTEMKENPEIIAVVGLGYVGLPLAAAFSEHYTVIGYDANREKIMQYRRGEDGTGEVGNEKLAEQYGSTPERDQDSGALTFSYRENGIGKTVWYADGETLAHWAEALRELAGGAVKISLWRL